MCSKSAVHALSPGRLTFTGRDRVFVLAPVPAVNRIQASRQRSCGHGHVMARVPSPAFGDRIAISWWRLDVHPVPRRDVQLSRGGESESGAKDGRAASQAASSEFRRAAAKGLAVGGTSQAGQVVMSRAVGSNWTRSSISCAASDPLVWPVSSASSALRARRLSCAAGLSWITPAASLLAVQPSSWPVSRLRSAPRARCLSSVVAVIWTTARTARLGDLAFPHRQGPERARLQLGTQVIQEPRDPGALFHQPDGQAVYARRVRAPVPRDPVKRHDQRRRVMHEVEQVIRPASRSSPARATPLSVRRALSWRPGRNSTEV